MKKIKTYIWIIAATATLAACSSTETETSNENNTPAVPVKVMTVNHASQANSIQASGSLQAVKSANLSTRMMGNVKQVLVKGGQAVKKGDLLLSISSADLSAKRAQVEANIITAETAFKDAKKDLERFENLKEKGSASQNLPVLCRAQ